MIVYIWTRNDGTGMLDDEFRDGDIMMTRLDSEEPVIGDQEKMSWLLVKIPDPPNLARVREALVESDYTIGAGGEPLVSRARKYKIDWRPRFTEEERAIITSGTQTLGIVADRFTIADVIRKN